MKNTKKQKRPAAEEEAGGNKSSPAEKDFNPVKKERDYRRKPPKERGKTTPNTSKTSCTKATSELAHNRYQTTALYKSNKTKQQQQGEVEKHGTRKDQTGPDRTGPDKRHTSRNRCQQTSVFFFFFFFFFGISLFSKMAKQCDFKEFSSSQISSNFLIKNRQISL